MERKYGATSSTVRCMRYASCSVPGFTQPLFSEVWRMATHRKSRSSSGDSRATSPSG